MIIDIKQVSVREFQLHPTQCLKNLPIVLTQYGKPVAKVLTHTESVNTNAVQKGESVNTPGSVAWRKKACPKHKIFTCGCPETEKEKVKK